MATKRMLQIGEQIREHIATMLAHGDIADPRLKKIAIYSVKMSPDLSVAKVYYSGAGDEQEFKAPLKRAAGYIRRELGKVLQIRHIPELIFYYDDSITYSIKMHSLLNKVSEEFNSTNDKTIAE